MIRRYFDWAATALPLEACSDVSYGNPSSLHSEGKKARHVLEDARERCAALLKVPADTLYWTSGGSESNAIVLFSFLKRKNNSSFSVLTSCTEHPSIRKNTESLSICNIKNHVVNCDKTGIVTSEILTYSLASHPDAALITVMHVQNEIGAINDIQNLAITARTNTKRKPHFHSDMVQSLGKIPCFPADIGVDSASFSSHKIGGPRGIGLLYLARPAEVFISGGGQERGVRPGTENVAGAVAFTRAMERVLNKNTFIDAENRMERLIRGLHDFKRCSIIPSSRNEKDGRFSPYILQAAFSDIPGEVMLRALDDAGFAVSTGSACSSGGRGRPVLAAMGIDKKKASEGIRISQGFSTTYEDIEALLSAIKAILSRL